MKEAVVKIVLLGAPGVGKGTQAKRICSHFDIPQISTGDLFRDAIRFSSPLGLEAQAYMDRGDLVPDSVVIKLVEERLVRDDCRHGYVLDGFPRTVAQAETLAGIDTISLVIHIDLEREEILRRLTGRRVCKSCGFMYHVVFSPPQVENVCDRCGSELYQRVDDSVLTIEQRLAVYRAETEPLVEYYRRQGSLKTIIGNGTPDEISEQIFVLLATVFHRD